MGEILHQSVRDVGAGLTLTFNYGLSIVVSLLFPFLTGSIGDGWTFIIFSLFSAIAFVFIMFVVPETKGRTLEDIQQDLRSKS